MSTARIAKFLLDLREGFWVRPLVLLLFGVAAGLGFVELDHWLIASNRTATFATSVSPSGARALLSAAGGALATTLAISLSMTMLTVQLASSQYTPRLMRRYLSDRFTQRVLGAFLATIAYSFLVLRAIRSPDEGAFFVPLFALSVAVVTTLACFGLLVIFLHRTMRSVQASTIVASLGRDTVQQTFAERTRTLRAAPVSDPSVPQARVVATASGYLQVVDDDRIRDVVAQLGVRAVRREVEAGTFVLPGTPLLVVFGVTAIPAKIADTIRDSFALGSERTQASDIGFGIRQLVDIALKALSPGINDTTTSVMVVNELGAIGCAVAACCPVTHAWRLRDNSEAAPYEISVLTLERFLELAFAEIILAAMPQPRVHLRILEVLVAISRLVGADPIALAILGLHEQRIRAAIGPSQPTDRDVPTAERARLLAAAPQLRPSGHDGNAA